MINSETSLPTTKSLIYHHIARHGSLSKADLLLSFALTGSKMTRLLDELVSDNLLLESGLGPSSGGRRPILYEVNPNYGYFFGLDISRRYSTLGFFDMKLNAMSFMRWRMDEAMTPVQLVRYVADAITSILHDHKIDRDQVLGTGIGAVGPLDREAGLILKPLYFPAPGWADVPICSLLAKETRIPAQLENGANTALMGEHWSMRKENLQHMLYVHAGVGLRSAIMSYGQIVHGSVDMEGSIGQMIIQADGPRLQDEGNFGALEAYVSVEALEKQAQSLAKLGYSDLPDHFRQFPERIRYDGLLETLEQHNSRIQELFHHSAVYFGIGLANLINTLHPEKIIVGGALVNSHERFFQTSIEIALKNTYYSTDYHPVFSKGELREDAVATGAALMVRQRLIL